MKRSSWRFKRNFMAYHFAIVRGEIVGCPEEDTALLSFNTMYTQQLVSGWTLKEALDVCENRVFEMRKNNIPHHAFCMVHYPYEVIQDTLKNSVVFLRIQPSKHCTDKERDVVKYCVEKGLAFILHNNKVQRLGGE